MSFNIREFKSKIHRYGGVARKNLFVFEIYKSISNVDMTPESLRFFCVSTSLPSIDLTVQDYFPNAFGKKKAIPISLNQNDVSAVFLGDSRYQVLSFFHKWIQEVMNYDVSGGLLNSINGQLPYEAGYLDEVTAKIVIRHYCADNLGVFYEYTLYDCFPTQVGELDVSWEDNDSYMTIPVNFTYSGFSVTSAETGLFLDRLSRGTGFLDFINGLSASYQAIQQENIPNSISDAIDRFTTVTRTTRQISSSFNNLSTEFSLLQE